MSKSPEERRPDSSLFEVSNCELTSVDFLFYLI